MTSSPSPPTLGRCKWFDEKKGFGFIVVCDGPSTDSEVFVHFKDIRPLENPRKSLRKGEYVHMRVVNTGGGNKPHAEEVTGVNGGPLMCDHFVRRSRETTENDDCDRE